MDQKKACPLLLAADISGRTLTPYELGATVHALADPGCYGDAARRAVACPGARLRLVRRGPGVLRHCVNCTACRVRPQAARRASF